MVHGHHPVAAAWRLVSWPRRLVRVGGASRRQPATSVSPPRSFRGNPYLFLGRRPLREARLRAYVVRQHRAGRHLTAILADPYVRRLGSESFCWTVIGDPDTLQALQRNIRECFADDLLAERTVPTSDNGATAPMREPPSVVPTDEQTGEPGSGRPVDGREVRVWGRPDAGAERRELRRHP